MTLTPTSRQTPTRCVVTYLDANNLYGSARSEPLPVGDFRFLTPEEISQLDLMNIAEDSPTGYIIDCVSCTPATSTLCIRSIRSRQNI